MSCIQALKIRYYILLILIISTCSTSFAQQAKRLIAEGNQLYQKGKYKEAAIRYGQALKKDTASTTGYFNLGNALYKQKQLDAARNTFTATAKKTTDKNVKAKAEYNIGNTYMDEKKWEDAIETYKDALRKNPQDADAKYNLSYAKSMLKKEGGGGGKNDKNKDQDKKDKDKKDQQNKDEQDKKDQQDKDQGKQDQDKKDQQDKGEKKKEQKEGERPQPQPSKLSQQQADQLLDALQQEEKKLQDKNKKIKGVPVKVEKDW